MYVGFEGSFGSSYMCTLRRCAMCMELKRFVKPAWQSKTIVDGWVRMAADHPVHKGGSCNPCHQWLNQGNYCHQWQCTITTIACHYYYYMPVLLPLPLPCHQWVNQSALLLAMKSKSPSKALDGHWYNTEPPEWSDALWPLELYVHTGSHQSGCW